MGFLNSNSQQSIFVDINGPDKKRRVRPLISKPQQKWLHSFPTPETIVQVDGKPVQIRLRDYHEEVCVGTDRRGSGCLVHNRPDPAWNYLSQRDQNNKKGQRVDFPSKPKYFTLVWDYDDNRVAWLRGGNQIYGEMDKWDDTGRSIEECDWLLWKIGQGKTTEYQCTRLDSTTFTVEVPQADKEAAMHDLQIELTPLSPQALEQAIAVMTPEQALAKYLESQRPGGNSVPQLPPASVAPQLPPAVAPVSPQVEALRKVFPGMTDDQINVIISGAAANPQ